METLKKCHKCKKDKPLSEFGFIGRLNKYQDNCKVCINDYYREWRKENKGKYEVTARERRLKRKFGISQTEYDLILDSQDGKCAICGKPLYDKLNKRLSVDHNHDTGKVRGLLCSACNQGLGYFKDNPDLLLKASTYLISHET